MNSANVVKFELPQEQSDDVAVHLLGCIRDLYESIKQIDCIDGTVADDLETSLLDLVHVYNHIEGVM